MSNPRFVVESPAMKELLSMADRAAKSPAKILITGESGVGKDLVEELVLELGAVHIERTLL